MGRHPERQVSMEMPRRGKAKGRIRRDIKSNGKRLYALLRGGKPIASMFHLQPPPDICA